MPLRGDASGISRERVCHIERRFGDAAGARAVHALYQTYRWARHAQANGHLRAIRDEVELLAERFGNAITVFMAAVITHCLPEQAARDTDANARAHPARPHAANGGSAKAN